MVPLITRSDCCWETFHGERATFVGNAIECVTVVLVGAVRVAVDDAGLSVRGPAGVSDAEVCEELLLQVQRVFLWRRKGTHPFMRTSASAQVVSQKKNFTYQRNSTQI